MWMNPSNGEYILVGMVFPVPFNKNWCTATQKATVGPYHSGQLSSNVQPPLLGKDGWGFLLSHPCPFRLLWHALPGITLEKYLEASSGAECSHISYIGWAKKVTCNTSAPWSALDNSLLLCLIQGVSCEPGYLWNDLHPISSVHSNQSRTEGMLWTPSVKEF